MQAGLQADSFLAEIKAPGGAVDFVPYPLVRDQRGEGAQRVPISDAILMRGEGPVAAPEQAFRPGMGQYLPDRLFWAREADGEEDDK